MVKQFSDQSISVVSAPGEMPLRLHSSARNATLIVKIMITLVCFAAIVIHNRTEIIQLPGHSQEIWEIVPVALGCIGIFNLWRAVVVYFRHSDIEINESDVCVTHHGILGEKSWSEPLSAYKGIRWQKKRHRSQDGLGDVSTHVIDLAHDDDNLTVPLHIEATRGEGPRTEWEAFVRQIGLPAIDTRHGEETVREADDIDKSVQELAHEGKLKSDWGDQPKPREIEIEHLGDTTTPDQQEIRIILRSPAIPKVISYPLYLILFIIFITGLLELEIMYVFLATIFAGSVWFGNRWAAKNPPRLTLTRRTITYDDPSNDKACFSLPLDAIESVTLTKSAFTWLNNQQLVNSLPGGDVVLGSDEGEKSIGGNLSHDALRYLHDFIRAAVVNA